MKHKWEQTSGMSYRCKRCLEMDSVSSDWCDSFGINADLNRIALRNDCRGKRRKSRAKPKLEYTRRELLIVRENHGGYLAGSCSLCGSSGWIDQIEHHASCILYDPKIVKVKLKLKLKLKLVGVCK